MNEQNDEVIESTEDEIIESIEIVKGTISPNKIITETKKMMGVIYCVYCDIKIEFGEASNYSRCSGCGRLVHRKVTDIITSKYFCALCENSYVIPYLEQDGNKMIIKHIFCDCDKTRDWMIEENKKREDNHEKRLYGFEEKFRAMNTETLRVRWARVQKSYYSLPKEKRG